MSLLIDYHAPQGWGVHLGDHRGFSPLTLITYYVRKLLKGLSGERHLGRHWGDGGYLTGDHHPIHFIDGRCGVGLDRALGDHGDHLGVALLDGDCHGLCLSPSWLQGTR